MDIAETDRHYVYKHMSHSADINANIYQVPLVQAEVLKVAPHLFAMDGAESIRADIIQECHEYVQSKNVLISVDASNEVANPQEIAVLDSVTPEVSKIGSQVKGK